MRIPLGSSVVDFVTGFSGIVTSRVEYLTGCVQYGITPHVLADMKLPETGYFDESRIRIVSEPVVEPEAGAIHGGPSIAVPSRETPGR